MREPLTAGALFERCGSALALQWIRGRSGAERTIHTPAATAGVTLPCALVGHLNLAYPNQIQVLGGAELHYLHNLRKNSHRDAIRRLFELTPAAVIVADGKPATDELLEYAESSATPLFVSQLESTRLISQISETISGYFCDEITIHAVCMEVMGVGILVTGVSGIGKSELALELVSRGHRLVADDAPRLIRAPQGWLVGSCPSLLQDFLEVRGLGILNIRAMFGDSAIKHSKRLALIIHLKKLSKDRLASIDRLNGEKTDTTLLGVTLPRVTLPVAPGRNLAVLVEAAVRNFALYGKGYDAVADFTSRQRESMGKGLAT